MASHRERLISSNYEQPGIIQESRPKGVHVSLKLGDPFAQTADALVCPFTPDDPFTPFQSIHTSMAQIAGRATFDEVRNRYEAFLGAKQGHFFSDRGTPIIPVGVSFVVDARLPRQPQVIFPIITGHHTSFNRMTAEETAYAVLETAQQLGISSVVFPVVTPALENPRAFLEGTLEGVGQHINDTMGGSVKDVSIVLTQLPFSAQKALTEESS